jgi:hypothetical protein
MNATKRRGLTRFWLEWGRIRDVGNVAYSKCEGVGDFFGKWGDFGFRGVCGFVLNVGGVSGVMGWPNMNTNAFLITCGDLKFRVGDKGVKSFVPPDEEPGIVDEFKG